MSFKRPFIVKVINSCSPAAMIYELLLSKIMCSKLDWFTLLLATSPLISGSDPF